MFMWNYFLVRCIAPQCDYRWIVPVIHGYVGFKALRIFGRRIDFILVSRRSKHFAGTRYHKRGVNEEGKVANDVETEQIVIDVSIPNGSSSSYVTVRGSIPLFWYQDPNPMLPRPPIVINSADMF
jgi:hypothetical protein